MRLTVLHLRVADLPSDTLTSGDPPRSIYGRSSDPLFTGLLPGNIKHNEQILTDEEITADMF